MKIFHSKKIEIEPSPLSQAFKIIDDLILMIEHANWPEAFNNGNVYNGVDEGVVKSSEFFNNIKEKYKELKDATHQT
jgi:hypothetical protein